MQVLPTVGYPSSITVVSTMQVSGVVGGTLPFANTATSRAGLCELVGSACCWAKGHCPPRAPADERCVAGAISNWEPLLKAKAVVRGSLADVYDRFVPDVSAFVDEVANELATWPGVRIERRADGAAIVSYESSELGVLNLQRGVAELPVLEREHDLLIEHGDAEPAELTENSLGVSHSIHGPADITAVLELFDRRYRDVRGEDDPFASEDPDYPHGRLDQL